MGKTHDRLVEKRFLQLKLSGNYTTVAKNQIYPLSPHTQDGGEIDVIAMNPNKGLLEIHEIKSSPNYIPCAVTQLERAKKYYKNFQYSDMNFFIYYNDYGLERLLEVKI